MTENQTKKTAESGMETGVLYGIRAIRVFEGLGFRVRALGFLPKSRK